jgi:hypothetical protein
VDVCAGWWEGLLALQQGKLVFEPLNGVFVSNSRTFLGWHGIVLGNLGSWALHSHIVRIRSCIAAARFRPSRA